MFLIIVAMEILAAGAIGTLLARQSRTLARLLGCGSAIAGCGVGLVGALQVLLGGETALLRANWLIPSLLIPQEAFFIEADAVSAFFLVPLFALAGLAALYGGQYLWSYREHKSMARPWFFYNILVISMALVMIARNAVLFLVAWEVMALSSFFLVTFEDEREAVQRAGWTYLVATHLGTAALFIMFLLMGRTAGSLNFDLFAGAGAAMGPRAGIIFILAVIGFGAKAGIMPMHVWLPEAHPAAPSHVSAVMSGVMIKTGIYGIIRVLMWLGQPQPWWAWTLIALGALSALGGVLFALAQHDLKRLLAYSSVENIGIILMALGLGVLGQSCGATPLTVLGYSAAFLHILNHAVFKGLLFMDAGSVLHATHTLEIDQTGGLLRRMPWTGGSFLIGAVAICALPPFNGFASEFLLYYGSFAGLHSPLLAHATAVLSIIGALSLVGGLAAVCFTKAFGMAFLGEPRMAPAAAAHEAGWAMRVVPVVLAAVCLLIGLRASAVLAMLRPAISDATSLRDEAMILALMQRAGHSLELIAWAGLALLVLIGGLALLRRRLLAGRTVGQAGTWDCGYARPTARMQYSGSSFVQPMTGFFASLLRTRRRMAAPKGLFPARAALTTRTPDAWTEYFFRPIFKLIEKLLVLLRPLQTGNVHLYILYIAVTLIVLLIWKLR